MLRSYRQYWSTRRDEVRELINQLHGTLTLSHTNTSSAQGIKVMEYVGRRDSILLNRAIRPMDNILAPLRMGNEASKVTSIV